MSDELSPASSVALYPSLIAPLVAQVQPLTENIALNRNTLRTFIRELLQYAQNAADVALYVAARLTGTPFALLEECVGQPSLAACVGHVLAAGRALPCSHKDLEAAEVWIWLLLDLVLDLEDNSDLQLFALELVAQYQSANAHCAMAVQRSEVCRVLLRALQRAVDNNAQKDVLEALVACFCRSAELGGVDYAQLRDFYAKIVSLDELKALSSLQSVEGVYKGFLAGLERHKDPKHYVEFQNHSFLEFHHNPLGDEGFTVQFWAKFQENVSENTRVPLFQLLNAKKSVFWEVLFDTEEHCFCLRVVDSDGFTVQRTFTDYGVEMEPLLAGTRSRFHNLVLIHKFGEKGERFKPSHIHFVVDGEHVQTVSVPMSTLDTLGEDVLVRFGNCKDTPEFKVSIVNALFFNKIQPHEWVLLNFLLGPDYHHNYEDVNAVNKFLGYRERTLLELQMEAARLRRQRAADGALEHSYEALNARHARKASAGTSLRSGGRSNTLVSVHALLNFHAKNVSDNSSILLDGTVLNTARNSVHNPGMNGAYHGIKSGTIILYSAKSTTLSNFFYAADGLSTLLRLMENVQTSSRLVVLLKSLFCLISQLHLFAREMEEKGGYHILLIILRSKKKLCTLSVLDTILSFVGYDHTNPGESVIAHPVAYKSLIVDFDLWKEADNETFRFLLFQFTVFSQDSRHHEHNVAQIVKMKIIKRFVQCLKANVFSPEFLASVLNTLLVLIKANPTSDIFHALNGYIVYALHVNKSYTLDTNLVLPHQKQCGLCVLDLVLEIAANQPSVSVFRRLAKLFTVRWLLLVMDSSDPEVSVRALNLLARILGAMGRPHYAHFVASGGFSLLEGLVARHYAENSIASALVCAALGNTAQGASSVFACVETAARNGAKCSMPEFLDLVAALIRETHDDAALETLTNITNALEYAFINVPAVQVAFRRKQFIFALCNAAARIHNETRLKTQRLQIHRLLKSVVMSLICSNESYMLLEQAQPHAIAKKVIMGFIYPLVLEEVLPLVEGQSSKLRKKSVCKNVCKFLLQMADAALKIVYERPDLLKLCRALAKFIENCGSRYEASLLTLRALQKYLGSSTLQLLFLLVYALTEEHREEVILLCNSMLYHQELYFGKGVLDSHRLFVMTVFLLQAARDVGLREGSNVVNSLRILYMHREGEFDELARNFENPTEIRAFFSLLLVLDDASVVEVLSEDKVVHTAHEKALFDCFERYEITFLSAQSPGDALRSTAIPDSQEGLHLFRAENVTWTASVVALELAKYYRHFQDQQDNLQFFLANFLKMKLEGARILGMGAQAAWTVDSIEGVDRIHKRMVPKDELFVEDQLMYKMVVPVKEATQKPIQAAPPTPLLYDEVSEQMEALLMESSESEDYEVVDSLFESGQEDRNRKVLRSLFVGDHIVELWNVSQLLGLEAEEGILILGETHLYLIENYFHCDNDEVVDVDDAPPEARDPYLQLITGQPKPTQQKKVKSHGTKLWELERLALVSKRQFLLRDVAIEFFFAGGSSFLIICRNSKERDQIHAKLSQRAKNSHIDSDLLIAMKLADYAPLAAASQGQTSLALKLASALSQNLGGFLALTKKWKTGKISNFYYLMLINTIAGRTFNDLTQYPVFPWVLADYTSLELDLTNPKTFRDFSKPMGAQHDKRAQQFQERYEALKSLNDPNLPPFHYGTHYSLAMIVTSFLIRLEPYVQSYLLLQGGKFDHADRLFYSVEKAWNLAARDNYADVRELIPEFFYLPEFLVNLSNYNLGELQNGTAINNVILPPWAHNDPKIFIQKQREALESPYVSAHLHEWIDLVFGYRQQGPGALEKQNVFNHLSYRGAVNLDEIDDDLERRSATGIIHNFGQTPLQIFQKPHAKRECLRGPTLEVFQLSDIPYVESVSSQALDHVEMTPSMGWKGGSTLQWSESGVKTSGGSSYLCVSVNGRIFEGLHESILKVLVPIGERSFITGADDGTIHVWRYPIRAQKYVTFNSSPVLSHLRFLEELEFREALRGHMRGIKTIRVLKLFNLAVSLDEGGSVMVWDLARLRFVRELDTEPIEGQVKHVAVSNVSGNVLLASELCFGVYTVNGALISSESAREKITCVGFARRQRGVGSDQARLEDSHEWWEEGDVFLVGSSRGVSLHLLRSRGEEDGGWEMPVVGNFKVRGREGDVVQDGLVLTCVEMQMGGSVVAGDSKGRLVVWK